MADRVIIIRESLRESILSDTYSFFTLLILLFISIYVGSGMAYIVGSILLFVLIGKATNPKRLTIPEARKVLDRMEEDGNF
jgi:hypothetical protein